jgi:hypothetical protein
VENDRDEREAVDHEAERAEAEPVDGEEGEPGQTDDDAGGRPVDRFRRSAGGAVVAAGLLGLRDALEGRPEKEEVTIVNEAPAAPPRDLEVVIDFDHPERSVAVVRHPEDEEGEPER